MSGAPTLATGFDLQSYLKSLPAKPGVYRMLDAAGGILYVGKARHLRNRVSSYFHGRAHADRTLAMLGQVGSVEVTVTASETEALLLEYNLIKQHKPRYNVMLKDDKSFPFIHVSGHEYPRIAFYRGTRKLPGRFFGPYPSAAATRETMLLLQKLFRLRPCEDTFFANRSRPCLQYQINRCTGPCVRLITPEAYAQDIADATKVLDGRNNELIEDLGRRMDEASSRLAFEQAARLRDQIQMLKSIQATQVITRMAGHDIDAVGIACEGGATCVSVVFVRGGRNLGSSNYFPRGGLGDEAEMLAGFLSQYYFSREVPAEILLSRSIEGMEALEQALTGKAGHAVSLRTGVRGTRARWLEMARNNAQLGLRMRASTRATIADQLEAVGRELNLGRTPQRLECFDVSHSMGESAVASCVVFGPEGPVKSDYRRFNLREITPGDDFAGIEQAVERRFARVLKGEAPMPDLLMIDGGPGQLHAATNALARLGITDLAVISVAKGADRRVGQERLFFPGQETPLILSDDSAALRLIQRVRDEAHRFAITGHRQSRDRSRRESWLEEIPGLGPRRRRELLKAFGGLQGIRQASVEDLARVHGISRQLAVEIYERMNPGPA
jgi:excinuclease ABC subunit C